MARLVEVWDYFRAPMSENDMIRMRRTFSIINLDKCTFEFQLPPRWPEGGLCAIVFYYKKKMIYKEEYSTMSLAKARLDWLSTFVPKKEEGELEYKGMPINVDDVVAVLNETTGIHRNISVITSRIKINDSVNRKSCYTILEEIQKKFIR